MLGLGSQRSGVFLQNARILVHLGRAALSRVPSREGLLQNPVPLQRLPGIYEVLYEQPRAPGSLRPPPKSACPWVEN